LPRRLRHRVAVTTEDKLLRSPLKDTPTSFIP
jgi:hypothetical protein